MKCTWCQQPGANPELTMHGECLDFPEDKLPEHMRKTLNYIAEVRPPFIIHKQRRKPIKRDVFFYASLAGVNAEREWRKKAKEAELRIVAKHCQ
jgi:hypothetical protein